MCTGSWWKASTRLQRWWWQTHICRQVYWRLRLTTTLSTVTWILHRQQRWCMTQHNNSSSTSLTAQLNKNINNCDTVYTSSKVNVNNKSKRNKNKNIIQSCYGPIQCNDPWVYGQKQPNISKTICQFNFYFTIRAIHIKHSLSSILVKQYQSLYDTLVSIQLLQYSNLLVLWHKSQLKLLSQ